MELDFNQLYSMVNYYRHDINVQALHEEALMDEAFEDLIDGLELPE